MPTGLLRFDVFGRRIGVVRGDGGWRAVFLGEDGKHRPAPAVTIPEWVQEEELASFLADLFHESARPGHSEVIQLPDEGDATQ